MLVREDLLGRLLSLLWTYKLQFLKPVEEQCLLSTLEWDELRHLASKQRSGLHGGDVDVSKVEPT